MRIKTIKIIVSDEPDAEKYCEWLVERLARDYGCDVTAEVGLRSRVSINGQEPEPSVYELHAHERELEESLEFWIRNEGREEFCNQCDELA